MPLEVIVSYLLDHPRTNSWSSCTTTITTTLSLRYWASLGPVTSVPNASNLITMKDNMPRTTKTIVLPVFKRVFPTIQKANVMDISCKRLLRGDTCLQNHLSKSYNGKAGKAKNVSVCTQRCKCVNCQLYASKENTAFVISKSGPIPRQRKISAL